MDQIVQAAIAVMGPAAIWLSQARSAKFQRWACIIGIASQPFWFWALWNSPQWGVFVVAVVSALGWVKGLWVHWLAPRHGSGLDTIQLSPDGKRA